MMIKRQTIQRSLILDTVRNLRCHATADQIYFEVVKTHPAISKATVYRNLQQLCDEGLISKREMPNGSDCYDHICTNHYHAKCAKCGRVFDVDMDYIADLVNLIKDSHGFEFTWHDIIFKGICTDCKDKS